MNSTLTPEQNESARKAFGRLIAKCGDNMSVAARLIGRDPATMSRFMRGKDGISHTTAAIIASKLEESLNDILGIRFQSATQIQDLPGYAKALIECRRFTKYPESLWDAVGETVLQPHPVAVDTMFLMRMAEVVESFRAKLLTSGTDTSPPSRPGGQRTSGGRIRKR